MIRKTSNRRGALVWAAVFFLAAVMSYVFNFQLRAGAVRGAFGGTELEAQVLLVAESAADELVLAAAKAANSDGDLASALRDPSFAMTGAARQAARSALQGKIATPLTSELIARLAGAAKITVRERTFDVEPLPCMIEGESRAQVTVTVKVEGRVGRRGVTRTFTRRHALRLSRMGAPAVFAQTALYIEDGAAVARDINAMADTLEAVLSGRLRDLAPLFAGAAAGTEAAEQRARLEALNAWLTARRARPSPSRVALLISPQTASIPDLGALVPRARWTAAQEAVSAANAALVEASSTLDAGEVAYAVDEALAACEDLQKEVDDASDAWVEVSHESEAHRQLAPAIESARSNWTCRSWFELGRIDELADLLGTNAAARNGVVALTANAEPLDLDGRAIWAGASKGRLVLVVRGTARLHDIPANAQGSLTIVTEGPVELVGRVDADVVALQGLKVAPGARVRGHLTVLGGAVELGEGASLERTLSTGQPAHAAFDPFPAPATVD